MYSDLSARGDDRFLENSKWPEFFQADAEERFFASKELLIEAADGEKGFSARKQKRACTELGCKVDGGKHLEKELRPERNRAIKPEAGTAAGAYSRMSDRIIDWPVSVMLNEGA